MKKAALGEGGLDGADSGSSYSNRPLAWASMV
jgi:hypothetical protein